MKLHFAQKLMLLRKNKKLSQKQLADILDIGANNIARYETGRLPNAPMLIRLSEFFNVSIDFLLKDDVQEDEELRTIMDRIQGLKKEDQAVVKGTINGLIDSFLKNKK